MVWETTEQLFYWNGSICGPDPVLLVLGETAILNFNEDDVNQCDNLASKDDSRAPRSTLLDKVNWKRGSPYNNLASRNDIRRLLSTLLDTRTLGDLIAMT